MKWYGVAVSSHERKVDRENQQRLWLLERDHGICICGRKVDWFGSPQVAHFIPNTKANRSRYGNAVVDSTMNKKFVCCLLCNNAIQLTNQPVQRDGLAEAITSGDGKLAAEIRDHVCRRARRWVPQRRPKEKP